MFDGNILETIVYPKSLSHDEVAKLTFYMMFKWPSTKNRLFNLVICKLGKKIDEREMMGKNYAAYRLFKWHSVKKTA